MVNSEQINNIPGTVLNRDKMGGAAGLDFLNKVFYITDRIMLAQIKEITGIDGSTLQNWLKRGWVGSPEKKSYTKEHLARILIINMMRDTMQLSRIIYLLEFINGKSEQDIIVSESELYGYTCGVLDKLSSNQNVIFVGMDDVIDDVLSDYVEPITGAKRRLALGIKIITLTYCSSVIKDEAETMLDNLGAEKPHKKCR
jgi:DNA-binding transcriptional MerR regulator